MRQCYDIVKTKLLESFITSGYRLAEDSKDSYSTIFISEKDSVKLEYNVSSKLFCLYRGDAEALPESFVKSQTYLFDHENGDDVKEAIGVANEFIDSMQIASAKQASVAKQRKRKDTDENSAEFFVNRIPSIMPECREPLLKHKSHYGQVLPRHFCKEVVTVALYDMMGTNDKRKTAAFFDLLSSMYKMGDLDTRSIIVQVILNSIANTKYEEAAKDLLSDELKEAWMAGKKYIGKKVKPEKQSKLVAAGTLKDQM